MGDYIPGLVSVVIPTYKRADLLVKAIDTVLNQTYRQLELLVVNDNIRGDEFSQKLYEILGRYDDPRLLLVEQEKHINGAAARNAGIRVARGEYIAFQDDDDYWEPEKLERQVALLSRLDESWGAVSCLVRLYSDGRLISAGLPYRDGRILVDILDRRTELDTGALLIRRAALDDSGYFDEALRRHQDLQLFARLADKYAIRLDRVYLHNRECKDTQNRATSDSITAVKKAYFHSVQDILDRLSPAERKRVFVMHDFECAHLFLKDGKRREGFRRLFGILRSPYTVYLACNRVCRRLIGRHFRNRLNRRYAAVQPSVR